MTGMTQLRDHEGRYEVLLGGYGLGILLHNFAGAIEKEGKLVPELERRAKRPGKLSYFRAMVNEATTKRLFHYLDTYVREGHDRHYGMRNRPLYGEGGGCSAFGASFLETAGLLRGRVYARMVAHVQHPP